MNSKLVLANVSRWIARIVSIVISIFGLIFLIITFLAVQTESSIATFLCVYSLYFFGMLAGLATAWRKESLGAAILLALAVLYFILLLLNPSDRLGSLFLISQLFIGLLFLISWWLRRKPLKMESQEEMPTGEEKREN